MAKDSAPRFRLLGNEAMGGHRARQGFRFQDLWLSFQLLDWVEQDNFRGAVNEGVDDVDASWFRDDRRSSKAERSKFDWEIHQLKDTAITPKLLNEIFDAFRRKEAEFPATWSRYHLVATRCVERLNSLPALLRQTRNYLFTHGIGSPVAMAAIAEFGDKLKHLGVVVDPEFIVDRVELDFAAGWIGDKDLFAKQFNLRLAGRGIPPGRVEEAGQALVAMVSGGKVGGLVSRESVVELLDRFKPKIVAEPTLVAVELPAKQVEERRPRSETRSDEPALISVFPGGGVLLRLPGGAHGLIDCSMAAASQIIAYLNEHKVEVLEFVAISHLHVDRYSGLLSVISAVRRTRRLLLPSYTKRVHLRPRFLDQIEGERWRGYGIDELAHTNARSVIWKLADATADAARVEAFAADINDPQIALGMRDRNGLGPTLRDNDLCTVFRVSVGNRSFLITADASIKRWTHLVDRLLGPGESVRSDGFTLPHHGSRLALTKDILGMIAQPAGVYAVVDPAPKYRLPDGKVLNLVRDSGGEILVVDTAPVHLLLTQDGLFERRFALARRALPSPALPKPRL